MKNTMKLVGIIALVAVIALSFAACDNGSTSGGGGATKFEGTWVNEYALTQGFTDFSFTFKGNNWSFKGDDSNLSGTFTFTDTTITFVVTEGGSQTWTQAYTLIDNVFTIRDYNGVTGYGAFTKQ